MWGARGLTQGSVLLQWWQKVGKTGGIYSVSGEFQDIGMAGGHLIGMDGAREVDVLPCA